MWLSVDAQLKFDVEKFNKKKGSIKYENLAVKVKVWVMLTLSVLTIVRDSWLW